MHFKVATDRLVLEDEVEAPSGKDNTAPGNLEFPMRRSLEERYLEVMKQLQFGMYEDRNANVHCCINLHF